MNWKWRALAGALLLGGTVIWLPQAVTTSAATRYDAASTIVHSPAADNADNSGDNDGGDNGSSNNNNDNSSGNNNNNDNSSGNNNSNNNDNSSDVVSNPTPTSAPTNSGAVPNPNDLTGAHQQNGNLAVDMSRGNDHPVMNQPLQITITGSGAPIDQISLWADGGGPNAGDNNDDIAHVGVLVNPCNGANPCVPSWTIVGRNTGFYTIHAKVRDTSGNEVQTNWQILFSENPRS